jgi:major membrane immunogen (membrane-anchored lipoprotein)
MKKILFILVIILSCFGCKKVDNENSKFTTGTYYGEKTIYYSDTHYESLDTITIKFDSNTYSYSGSDALDFGRGNYLIKNNSIEFNDDEARNALYSWEWILGGTHKFRIIGDSLILNQNGSYIQVSCRFKKISGE